MSKGEIVVKQYTPEDKRLWDQFVEESITGTMFQKQAFLDYHVEGRFNFYHLMFWQDNELVALLPGGIKKDGDEFWSPMGASYGSIVTKDVPFEQALAIVDAMLAYFKKNNFKDIYLIPPPFIYNRIYNQHLEYAMLFRKFGFENHYISHAVHLAGCDNYDDMFDPKAKRTLRKIEREGILEIKESEDYDAFFPILLENKARHGVLPTHSLEDLHKLHKLMPEKLKLFIVYRDGKPISGVLNFLTNKKVALCFYIMMDYEEKHLRPNFLGMAESIRWAKENGYEWYDIGVSQDTSSDDPMTPALSLIYFKERFFARGILRTTYHYKFED